MPEFDNNWKSMKEGSKKAFLDIYQENYNILFSYGFSLTRDKELTKDCIQEVFLEIWKTRITINPDVQNVRSYLCTWLRRKIGRIQSHSFKATFTKEFHEEINEGQQSYEELLIAFQETEEKKEKISRALNNLTKKQIEVIRMKFFENLSYSQIAAKTSLSVRTVYNTIYMAIQQLREDSSLAENE